MNAKWILALVIIASTAGARSQASPTDWDNFLDADGGGSFTFGAKPTTQDGYDGQSTADVSRAAVYLNMYRENGPAWTGPSGFYAADMTAPLEQGESVTWADLRLWAHDVTPSSEELARALCSWATAPPPGGYTGILTLDYVPQSLGWNGPWQFTLDLGKTSWFYLPCPVTDDPFNPDNVTRMHLTVYTYPVPEPSSLVALGLALAGLGAVRLRRRR